MSGAIGSYIYANFDGESVERVFTVIFSLARILAVEISYLSLIAFVLSVFNADAALGRALFTAFVTPPGIPAKSILARSTDSPYSRKRIMSGMTGCCMRIFPWC